MVRTSCPSSFDCVCVLLIENERFIRSKTLASGQIYSSDKTGHKKIGSCFQAFIHSALYVRV